MDEKPASAVSPIGAIHWRADGGHLLDIEGEMSERCS